MLWRRKNTVKNAGIRKPVVPDQDKILALTQELVGIGRATSYVGAPDRDTYDEDHCHRRAREIGAELNAIGGMDLMLAVHGQVAELMPGAPRARELEACWGGVGQWMR